MILPVIASAWMIWLELSWLMLPQMVCIGEIHRGCLESFRESLNKIWARVPQYSLVLVRANRALFFDLVCASINATNIQLRRTASQWRKYWIEFDITMFRLPTHTHTRYTDAPSTNVKWLKMVNHRVRCEVEMHAHFRMKLIYISFHAIIALNRIRVNALNVPRTIAINEIKVQTERLVAKLASAWQQGQLITHCMSHELVPHCHYVENVNETRHALNCKQDLFWHLINFDGEKIKKRKLPSRPRALNTKRILEQLPMLR